MSRRLLPRLMPSVLLALLLFIVAGCASTNGWLVDPVASSRLHVVSVMQRDGENPERVVHFDAAGGRIDPTSLRVQGRTTDGDSVSVEAQQVTAFRFRYGAADAGSMWDADLDPLLAKDGWAPHDPIREVVCTNGRILKVKDAGANLDFDARVFRFQAADGSETAIPFGEIACVKTHEGHTGRTVSLTFFVAAFVGLGIAISTWSLI
jgi:hypothetical protein